MSCFRPPRSAPRRAPRTPTDRPPIFSSTTAAGARNTTANGATSSAFFSGDGSVVMFASLATDLPGVQADGNKLQDVFLYDVADDRISLLSHIAGAPGIAANGTSIPVLAGVDGRVLSWRSHANDQLAGVQDTNFGSDVFVRYRDAGVTRLVSHRDGNAAQAGDLDTFRAFVDHQGAWAVLQTEAKNLVPGDFNGETDVVLRRIDTGETILLSAAGIPQPLARTPNFTTEGRALSDDGRYALLASDAGNLLPEGLGNRFGPYDSERIFLHQNLYLLDRVGGGLQLVNRAWDSPSNTISGSVQWRQSAVLSGDGRSVLFTEFANVATPGAGSVLHAFVYEADTRMLVPVAGSLGALPKFSHGRALSTDGSWVLYDAQSPDVYDSGVYPEGLLATYLWDRDSGARHLVSDRRAIPCARPTVSRTA